MVIDRVNKRAQKLQLQILRKVNTESIHANEDDKSRLSENTTQTDYRKN